MSNTFTKYVEPSPRIEKRFRNFIVWNRSRVLWPMGLFPLDYNPEIIQSAVPDGNYAGSTC